MANNDGATKFPNYEYCCQIGETAYVVTGDRVVAALAVKRVRATISSGYIHLEYSFNLLTNEWVSADLVFNNPLDAFKYFEEIDDA